MKTKIEIKIKGNVEMYKDKKGILRFFKKSVSEELSRWLLKNIDKWKLEIKELK